MFVDPPAPSCVTLEINGRQKLAINNFQNSVGVQKNKKVTN